jgi:hypothetical protein
MIRLNKISEEQLDDIKSTYHCAKLQEKILNKADELRHSIMYDHESLPMFISNSVELKIDILSRSNKFGIQGNIELDQGYSFLYQITIFFPMHFQKQVIKTTFKPYDSNVPQGDEDSANLERVSNFQGKKDKVPISNLIRGVDNNEKEEEKEEDDEEGEGEDNDKKPGKAPTLTPLDSISDLRNDVEYKSIICLKLKRADWLDIIKVTPQICSYMRKQAAAILSDDNPTDLLLEHSWNLAMVQDISIINSLIEDISK